MVYCGKASQGCQNCRTRRIKCDKIKPECSQCVRVFKKCPGYRDQLSLMFRDESSKVIQKAHAQWGVLESPGSIGQNSVPTSSSQVTLLSAGPSSPSSPVSSTANHTVSSASPPSSPWQSQITWLASQFRLGEMASKNGSFLSPTVGPTLDEQGIQFYIKRYLIGHPGEPRSPQELASSVWLCHSALQDVMTAVGLAGLSNLTANSEMMVTARQRYGMALRHTKNMIPSSGSPSLEVTMRLVLMLAMFEVVKGTHHSTGSVHQHVMGAAALMRSWCPLPNAPFGGSKGLLQLCYSMFIPFQVAGTSVPSTFYDWIAFSTQQQPSSDIPSTDLANLIARFIQVSAYVNGHVLSDGRTETSTVIRQLLQLDSDLASWESSLDGQWLYSITKNQELPAKAVFEGEVHVYFDLWIARIWNHYRWARILTNQLALDLANQNPISSLPLISAVRRNQMLKNIRRLARDTLVSAPSHWRHPALEDKSRATVQSVGSGGDGAAGLALLLFHLKVAGCAPGVPRAYWEWSLAVIQCIWSDMGMLHARSMMEAMRAHVDTVQRSGAEGILSDD